VIYDPFAIVVVSFPFTDSSDAKRRPALVVSSKSHQLHSGHTTMCMITSAKHSRWPDDHEIIELKAAGLKATCVVRQKIFTLDSRLIIETIGQLAKPDRQKVSLKLTAHLEGSIRF
jgi:mRNA interferase MazF